MDEWSRHFHDKLKKICDHRVKRLTLKSEAKLMKDLEWEGRELAPAKGQRCHADSFGKCNTS